MMNGDPPRTFGLFVAMPGPLLVCVLWMQGGTALADQSAPGSEEAQVIPGAGALASLLSDEPGMPWAVGIAAQVDDAASRSVLATLNLGLRERTWLSVGAGRSRSPSERADVSVRTAYAGIDHRFGVLGVLFQAGVWGAPDALESTEFRGGLYVQRDRFRIGYEREHRDMELTFTVVDPQGGTATRHLDLVGKADALRSRVQVADRWQLYLTARRYSYSRDLSVLPRIAQLNLLSYSPLTLAYGFIEAEHAMTFEWEQGGRLISFGASRGHSAVDRSRMHTVFGGVMLPVSRRMDVEVTLGHGRWGGTGGAMPLAAGSSLYGGVLFLVYGG